MAKDKPEQGSSAQPVAQKANGSTSMSHCNRAMRKRKRKQKDKPKPYFVK